jgi:transcriptional regulator with XRE-family HTH domain
MNNAKSFGATLRFARKRAKKTMKDVSIFLGKSIPYIADVERDRRAPFSITIILKLEKYLNTPPNELLNSALVTQDSFRLNIKSPPQRELATALMRGWPTLSDDKAQMMKKLLEED